MYFISLNILINSSEGGVWSVMPAALAEMGFVTGQLDAPRLASPNHRRRLAQAVTKGILNYLR